MVLHILEHLLDERTHFLHLFVLIWMEVSFVLVVHTIRILFLSNRLHTSVCSQKLLFFRFLTRLEGIFAETEFVKFWCPIIWLEVVINVYEREICHSRPIYGLFILKSPRLRKSRFPIDI